MTELYPAGFDPDHMEILRDAGVEFSVPSVSMVFKQWEGEPVKYTFGNKPIVDYYGKPMFAELAIQRMASKAGWSARWVETYGMKGSGPYYFSEWIDGHLIEQTTSALDNPKILELQSDIARHNNNSYSGCWDVLAWNGDRVLYLESKNYNKDRIRGTQSRWLAAGLAAGLKIENFLVVQWKFEK